MSKWKSLFNNILSNQKEFYSLPELIQDMIVVYKNTWEVQMHDHPYPVLYGNKVYNCDSIKYAIKYLGVNNINGFIITGQSSATLELLYNLLAYNNGSYSYCISVDKEYYKNVINPDGVRSVVWGIVVKINVRKSLLNK